MTGPDDQQRNDGDDSGGAAKRAAPRDSLFLLATLVDDAGRALGRARVRNLSETGMMADCDVSFRDGDRLTVDLRGIGAVAGRVTWVRGDRIGMAFDSRIDPQAVRKPVQTGSAESLPVYLRQIPRISRFQR